MIKFKVVSIGKTKEPWLQDAIQEYLKRMTGSATFDFVLLKDDRQLTEYLEEEQGKNHVICLDPLGQEHDSKGFAEMLAGAGARVTFVIGGSEGLPQVIRDRFPLVSLSRMTFTHQITRLVLVEQVYRALEILKGSRYHK